MREKTDILLSAQRNSATNDPSLAEIYDIGTLASIVQLVKLPDGTHAERLVEELDRMHRRTGTETTGSQTTHAPNDHDDSTHRRSGSGELASHQPRTHSAQRNARSRSTQRLA